MSNHPRRHRKARRPAPRPPWDIAAVVGDPDKCENPGCDHNHPYDPDFVEFAYTIGLHKMGLPELHMSTLSADGETSSLQVVGHVLNYLAARCVAGTLHPGDEDRSPVCKCCDAVTVYTLGAPSTSYRNQLETFQTHPKAEVIPVTWAITGD
jgi:hypothetical protein